MLSALKIITVEGTREGEATLPGESSPWVRKPQSQVYRELIGNLAELAEKRGGRVAPGPEPPAPQPQQSRHNNNEAVQLFSELMQTDDVSTIAAQIANQAELIYQTWKTTGLNPTEDRKSVV